MSGFTDRQIIGGLVAVLITSYAAFFVWIVASIREIHNRIDGLDEKLTAKLDRLDENFTAKIESLTIAVSLESAVYRSPPEHRQAASDVGDAGR
jgi:hypothetical protein